MLKMYDLSKAAFQRVLQLEPENIDAMVALSVVNLTETHEESAQALKNNPQLAEGQVFLTELVLIVLTFLTGIVLTVLVFLTKIVPTVLVFLIEIVPTVLIFLAGMFSTVLILLTKIVFDYTRKRSCPGKSASGSPSRLSTRRTISR
jgi:cytochrome b subunit of formate dehydrogenase